jgi:hypothetical protein
VIDRVQGHHRIPGDHNSLVPVCPSCHRWFHDNAHEYEPIPRHPPEGQEPPRCACGCGLSVSWKRARGWAKYRKGHGTAKVPAGSRSQEAPKCACGCGQPTKFRHGKGWNEYKRGHSPGNRQPRPHMRKDRGPAPLCACGCGQSTIWQSTGGWSEYLRGHRGGLGRKAPLDENPPPCACGCGASVSWNAGHGWGKWVKGHHRRGQASFAGRKHTAETRSQMSESAKLRFKR